MHWNEQQTAADGVTFHELELFPGYVVIASIQIHHRPPHDLLDSSSALTAFQARTEIVLITLPCWRSDS